MAVAISSPIELASIPSSSSLNPQVPEIAEVFRGRELTRKDRRIPCDLNAVNLALGGGLLRGRLNEVVGHQATGKTSLAVSFLANATRRGETAAWIDFAGVFDPHSIESAGVDLTRVLWVCCADEKRERRRGDIFLKAAELVLETGGFGLTVFDFGDRAFPLTPGVALRLARRAERTAAAVLILAPRRICGTFAALTLTLMRSYPCFSRPSRSAPALFDGFMVEARVSRNKLGGTGGHAAWRMQIDPADPVCLPDRAIPQAGAKTRCAGF